MARPPLPSRPTLRDIARIVNLSPRAVSQALRDREGNVKVSEATRERVQKVAAELGYRQNIAARALKTGRTGLIGILSFQGQDALTSRHLYHAVQAAGEAGHTPVVYHADRLKTDACLAACHAMIDSNVDGVLLLAPSALTFPKSNVALLERAGIKVVAINAPWLTGIPCLVPDKQHGFEALARHLIAEGNRSITLVTWDLPETLPKWRYFHSRAAQAAIAKVAAEHPRIRFRLHGLAPNLYGDLLGALPGVHPLHVGGYVATRQLLEKGKLPDALMLQVDTWALGAMRACGEAGVRVPEDLAITGFEDDPPSAGGYVPLTTVAHPLEELARLALERLMALIRGEPRPRKPPAMPRGELIVRQSSTRRKLPVPDLAELRFI